MQFNLTLPSFSDIEKSSELESIKGYLSTLHDQLRYMMLNIDTENLSSPLNETINNAAHTADQAQSSIVKMQDGLSEISQTANKINWLIQDGDSSTNFTMTKYAVSLISDVFDIKSMVKFTDLQNKGSTIINGNNITTGSVTADKISVNDISSLSAKIGGFDLGASSISSKNNNGSLDICSASSESEYWISAKNAEGSNTFYIKKDGSCFFDGNFISDSSVSADKISVNDISSLSAKIGGFDLGASSISSENSNGSLDICSASSESEYWISAKNAEGSNTFYIKKDGSCFFDGNFISDSSVSADKISVSDISSISAKIGGFDLGVSSISSENSNGSLDICSASSESEYWISAKNAEGSNTFYIKKDGSCFFDGNFISGSSVSADKLYSDNEKRLDFTNNYYGIKVGKSLHISDGYCTRKIYLNTSGNLMFETGHGNEVFSLGVNYDSNGSPVLSVYDIGCNMIGSIHLS